MLRVEPKTLGVSSIQQLDVDSHFLTIIYNSVSHFEHNNNLRSQNMNYILGGRILGKSSCLRPI